MLTCKNCGKQFKTAIKIDGKLRVFNKRRFCLECSPYKAHNTRTCIEFNNEKSKFFPKRPAIFQKNNLKNQELC